MTNSGFSVKSLLPVSATTLPCCAWILLPMTMASLMWECFQLKEKFCPITTPAILLDGGWLVVSKTEGVLRVPPGFRGTTVGVRLPEAGCGLPSSTTGAAGPKSHPFSASGWQQCGQTAGGDAAGGRPRDLLSERLVGISRQSHNDLCRWRWREVRMQCKICYYQRIFKLPSLSFLPV